MVFTQSLFAVLLSALQKQVQSWFDFSQSWHHPSLRLICSRLMMIRQRSNLTTSVSVMRYNLNQVLAFQVFA